MEGGVLRRRKLTHYSLTVRERLMLIVVAPTERINERILIDNEKRRRTHMKRLNDCKLSGFYPCKPLLPSFHPPFHSSLEEKSVRLCKTPEKSSYDPFRLLCSLSSKGFVYPFLSSPHLNPRLQTPPETTICNVLYKSFSVASMAKRSNPK